MAIITDADALFQWLEDNHTLHKTVEALYVVDGYKVSLCYNHEPLWSVEAETLREAYVKAMLKDISENK